MERIMARNRRNRSRLKRSQRCPDIWEMIRRHCNGGGWGVGGGGKGRREGGERGGGKGRREGGARRWVGKEGRREEREGEVGERGDIATIAITESFEQQQ